MSLVHEQIAGAITIGAAASAPWTYLASGAVAAIVLVLLSNKLARRSARNSGVPLPPGPLATWFWEYPMPTKNIAQGLTALVEQYGPVVSFRRGSNVTIIIGRLDAATEIMEKEGGALVDRPPSISLGEILSGGLRLLFASAGERFRRLRRAAHTHLQPKAAEMYQGIQAQVAKDVILDILNDPKQHIEHVHRYATTIILGVTYGKEKPTSNDDPEVVRIRQVVENLQTSLRPGLYLVDSIPWLRYVPGYGRKLKEFHRFELSLFRDQLNRVKDRMATNSAPPSFGKTLLEHIDDHRLTDDEMAYLAGAFFGAGSDTTATGITIMIMSAAYHPDKQARVQDELDEVVGRDRVPTFEDWDMLPQLHAFMLEALRWLPIAPLGFAHRATKDIIWRGQCIPEGATVIGSHWVISRDPVAFPDPETFNPRRWLTEDGRVRTDLHFYTYGFGRRVCPGQHVANRSLYINLALLLWSYRILRRPDVPMNPFASNLLDKVVYHPSPSEADFEFVPRVEERRLRELMA